MSRLFVCRSTSCIFVVLAFDIYYHPSGWPSGLSLDFHVRGLKFENPPPQKQGFCLLGRVGVGYLSCVVRKLWHRSGVLSYAHPMGSGYGFSLLYKKIYIYYYSFIGFESLHHFVLIYFPVGFELILLLVVFSLLFSCSLYLILLC